MIIAWGKGRTRFMAVGVLVLFLIFIVHLLNFANPFSNPDELSASMDVITACATSDFENPDDSHSIAVPQIPNVVHQIWKTTDLRTYSTQMKASHDQWKQELEPLNYTIKLWTDDDILQLVKEKYVWFLSTYEAYPQNIQRADIARLLVIHAEGGIYADLDVYPNSAAEIQCLQSLNLEAILAPTSGTLGLSNHFFMAEPESPFILWALYEGKRRGGATSRFIPLPYLQVFWSTGPTMVTAAFRKYAWLHGTLRHTLGLLDDRYSRAVIQHKAGRSWHGSDGRALNYVGDNLTMNSLMVVVAFFPLHRQLPVSREDICFELRFLSFSGLGHIAWVTMGKSCHIFGGSDQRGVLYKFSRQPLWKSELHTPGVEIYITFYQHKTSQPRIRFLSLTI